MGRLRQAFVCCFVVTMLRISFAQEVRDLPTEWIQDIMSNQGDVERILEYLLRGGGQSQAYNRLAEFVDKFGNRFTGSKGLEDSIDYMVEQLMDEGFDNVMTEEVTVPRWVRGEERALLIEPREVEMYVLGLMDSIATDSAVEAEAIVVKDFDELNDRRNEVTGKIVVYNQDWTGYINGFAYRNTGATRAASFGAVGALIRSVTQFSLYTPHTGSQEWWSNVTKIPSGCITTEDAMMLQRMQERGDTIRIRLEASHEKLEDGISRNIIAEIVGSEKPQEVVMFGGHIDSWDVGVGAMDDGGGIMVSWQILTTLKQLNLRPKRTLRLVMWTAEEIGIVGGHAYWDRHQDEMENMTLVMESDYGTFNPLGLHFKNMSGLGRAIMEEILESYLHDINASSSTVDFPLAGTADISDWISNGVPGLGLYTQNDQYFYYHHTEADTMSTQDAAQMDRCAAVFAVTAYVTANLVERLPLDGDYPSRDIRYQSTTRRLPGVSEADCATMSGLTPGVVLLSLAIVRVLA